MSASKTGREDRSVIVPHHHQCAGLQLPLHGDVPGWPSISRSRSQSTTSPPHRMRGPVPCPFGRSHASSSSSHAAISCRSQTCTCVLPTTPLLALSKTRVSTLPPLSTASQALTTLLNPPPNLRRVSTTSLMASAITWFICAGYAAASAECHRPCNPRPRATSLCVTCLHVHADSRLSRSRSPAENHRVVHFWKSPPSAH